MTVRTIALCAALAVSAAACGSKSTPNTPNGPTTSTVTFQATLLPANEVPAFNNAESTATGSATITFHVTKDSGGTITSTTVDFQASIAGMPAGSTITMAHIHPGAAGVANGVLLGTGVASGDVPLTNGAGAFTKNGVTGLSAADAQAIINNPSAYYFNVHSVLNPPGFMRGQLSLKQ
jgi:hypothetical protein